MESFVKKFCLLVFIWVNCVFAAGTVQNSGQLLCVHSYNKVAHVTIEQPDPESIVDLDNDDETYGIDASKKPEVPNIFTIKDRQGAVVHYEKCKSSNFCYALWQIDIKPNGTNVVMGQGCWDGSNTKQHCDRSECISDQKPPKAANNTKFCCCSGNACNSNFTDMYVPSDEDDIDPKMLPPASEYLEQARRESQMFYLLMISSIVFVCILIGLAIGCVAYNIWHVGLIAAQNSKAQLNSVNMENGLRYTNGLYSVDHLKLISKVGQGRYGSVWKGTINDQDVAVKIFPAHYRNYFYNERDIYCLPLMENSALLSYFGSDERTNMDGNMEYLLLLSYAPEGCLQDYLKEHTLDWNTFCKMTLSVAKGLAHLHTDIFKGDTIKPCVSHRDLNTRNVLVKSDLSCCLCDLGFALKISNSKYYHNGEDQETKSLSEVGTLRYMAPEVLEGAVNLLDCESSLKQIDVYALGLVLWELATRCEDLYPTGVEIPPYKLPFENEVGLHPTFEQMQTVVSRHKSRPLWPPEAWNGRWGCTPTHRLVRETTEDCWDQDAEARLTALCVEERLHELPSLKDRENRVTIYTTAISPSLNPQIINNNHSYHKESTGNSVSLPSTGKDASDMSESTIETMYTITPSEAPETVFKNSNQTAAMQQNILMLQPFQGRNPCIERNLLVPGSGEDSQSPNMLIEKSYKPYSSETQNLIGHDFLNQNGTTFNTRPILNLNRPATPIPYVQNVVSESGYIPIPKTLNAETKNSFWGGWKRLFGKTREQILIEESEIKSNLLSREDLQAGRKPMETQVNLVPNKLVNGFAKQNTITSVLNELERSDSSNRRPSSLHLNEKPDNRRNSHNIMIHNESNPTINQKFSTVPTETDSLISPIKARIIPSGLTQIIKQRKSLSREGSLEQFNEVFSSNIDLSRQKDPTQRIKTPGDVPPSVRRNRGRANSSNSARFSLYDDRMMSINKYEDGGCEQSWSNSVPDGIGVSINCSNAKSKVLESLVVTNRADSVSSF